MTAPPHKDTIMGSERYDQMLQPTLESRHNVLLSSIKQELPNYNHLHLQSMAQKKASCIYQSVDQPPAKRLKKDEPVKKFKCDYVGCGKAFSKSDHLKTHKRTHTGERPYKCNICPKGFSDLANLKRHMRIHTGEKPFKCDQAGCGKTFSVSSNLKQHKRTHTGERPYVCEICGKTFSHVSSRRKHTAAHDEELLVKQGTILIKGSIKSASGGPASALHPSNTSVLQPSPGTYSRRSAVPHINPYPNYQSPRYSAAQYPANYPQPPPSFYPQFSVRNSSVPEFSVSPATRSVPGFSVSPASGEGEFSVSPASGEGEFSVDENPVTVTSTQSPSHTSPNQAATTSPYHSSAATTSPYHSSPGPPAPYTSDTFTKMSDVTVTTSYMIPAYSTDATFTSAPTGVYTSPPAAGRVYTATQYISPCLQHIAAHLPYSLTDTYSSPEHHTANMYQVDGSYDISPPSSIETTASLEELYSSFLDTQPLAVMETPFMSSDTPPLSLSNINASLSNLNASLSNITSDTICSTGGLSKSSSPNLNSSLSEEVKKELDETVPVLQIKQEPLDETEQMIIDRIKEDLLRSLMNMG